MSYDKRRWRRLSASERTPCKTPGCENVAREICRRAECGEAHCREHKGSHTAIHTLMKKRGIIPRREPRRWRSA